MYWDLSQRCEGVIRITFRITPSKDGGTSSEALSAWGQSPPGPHPIPPAAIPPRRYPGIRNNDVSFPLPSGGISQLEILDVPILLFPFQTDRSNYPYLRLYWIRANWGTRTTFRISPSTDSGTSSEARTAWVQISPESHPILPTDIPLRRYSTIRNSEASLPLHSERFHKVVAEVCSGSPLPYSIRYSYSLMLSLSPPIIS